MGECRPGLAWALGQAWRDLYSGVVRALGHQQVTQSAWSSFASAAAALEPIAFGPPVVNAAKLLALCDAGLVDASFLAGRWSDALHDADVVIDCVLPPPGLVEGELAADLMERGLVAKAAGRRGVSVAPDATCLTSDGTPIYAVSDGVVIEAGPTAGYGAYVKLRHTDGTVTLYGHINSWTVTTGQQVINDKSVIRRQIT